MKKKTAVKKTKPKKTVNHPALDRLAKFELTWAQRQAELVHKHNELATAIAAQEAMLKNLTVASATEFGKLSSALEAHVQALSGLDLNILASAEVMKNLVVQILSMNMMILKANPTGSHALSDEESTGVSANAEALFRELVSMAFKTVKARLEEDARKEREEAAKLVTEAEQAKSEAESIEAELKAAHEADRVINTNVGGPGGDFPEGAQIFGG